MSPVEVLDALDREFPFERFNNFFTINYFILNTMTGIANYANAGHPKPVLLRNNGSLEELESSGPPIGTRSLSFADEKILFTEEQIQLYPGDKVILYTDGLVEYFNDNDEYYGNDRFYDRLKELKEKPVTDIVQASIKSLKAFGKNVKPADDITLLGFELF
jgi:sigma-B regulation protein RsbU (phosphoserine phosphatase)